YRQFKDTGCLCKRKITGRPNVPNETVERLREIFVRSPQKSTVRASRELGLPQQTVWKILRRRPGRSRVSEENVERIRVSFERSPMKSTRSASRETGLSQTTVWRVLRRRLVYKPYHLQLVQALRANDKVKGVEFCKHMLKNMGDESFLPRVIFSDEATFHVSGKVNRHNVRIRGLQNPRVTLEHVRDSTKFNVFCALDGAPSHWHLIIRRFLNESLPHRGVGRMGNEDLARQFWPPRSPDLTPCDFFLWEFVKDADYIPPIPTNLNDLRNRITAAANSVTQDICHRVWDEFSYRLDVIRAAGGGAH
ncbi:hypothetical protein B7P43_G10811, partial [Cryptotermes secundus]